MHVYKYLNQTVERVGESYGKYFNCFLKKKQRVKGFSFITHFKIEFLLPFTCCSKVLGKMPGMVYTMMW